MLDYFSWARAKKNKEDLEKTNPQNPVLKEDDEQFLQKIATQDAPPAPLPPSVIADDGRESETQSAESERTAEAAGTVALPSTPPTESEDAGVQQGNQSEQGLKASEDTPGSGEPEAGNEKTTAVNEAEGAAPASPANEPTSDTAEHQRDDQANQGDESKSPQIKRTWASYVPSIQVPSIPVPSMPSVSWKTGAKDKKQSTSGTATPLAEEKDQAKVDENVPAKYPDGVKITEDVTLAEDKAAQDEKEVSVLLDRLNLSSINNRVFSFSKKSQQIYEEFTLILKDMINGVPTAYDDMDKLLKENEGHLGETFKNMPPFVQTLVKSLPAKLGSTLGPEVFAAASDKPGADMKARLASASSSSPTIPTGQKSKRKRNVPTTEALAKQKGAVASMLTNIVNFLKLRFPILLSTTNVVMSIAVFILLLVFWYCHKRGKETRLLKAAETDMATSSETSEVEEDEDSDFLEKIEHERKAAGQEEASEGGEDLKEVDVEAVGTAEEASKQPETLAESSIDTKSEAKTN